MNRRVGGSSHDTLEAISDQLTRVIQLLDRPPARDRPRARDEAEKVHTARARAFKERARPVAEEYLRALAVGDAATANRLSRINTRWPPNDFLRSEVYGAAERLTEPRLISPESAEAYRDENEVRYAVSYHLAGETVREAIRVTKDGDEWWISEGLVCPVPRRDGFRGNPAEQYSLGGARSAVGSSRTSASLAYVGVYPVTPPNPFYSVTRDSCVVLMSRSRSFFGDGSFAVVPTEAYVELVQRAVDDVFSRVTSAGTLEALREAGMRTSFNLSVPPNARVASLAVLEPPVVAISDVEYEEFAVSQARVIVSAYGENFRDEVVNEDIVGSFRFSVKTTVSGGSTSVRVTH